jgi:hypothetical protein
VTKRVARIWLIIFSVCWLGWTLLMLIGVSLGDCFDGTYSRCWAAKEYGPALTLWRGLAVELLAVTVYLLYSRRRVS